MQVLTIKAKPKTIFGIILAVTGVIVILLTFIGNHNSAAAKAAMAEIKCATADERLAYIASLGWECSKDETEKAITIPNEFNDVYTQYNEVQKEQGFDLEKYKGQSATLYTYNITNYKSNKNVIADLIVCNGVLIGADLCDTSADNGFLVGLSENDKT
ncbi:MAG: DUF4830 domain-containing protein [Eubacterium sp.]